MRRSRITNLINTFNDCVGRRIVTYGIIRTEQIIINSSRNPNDFYTVFFCEFYGAGKRTVTSNDNECIYVSIAKVFCCFCSALRCSEFLRTSTFQECSAKRKNMLYT